MAVWLAAAAAVLPIIGAGLQYSAAGKAGDVALAQNATDYMNAIFASNMASFNAESVKTIAGFNSLMVRSRSAYDAALIEQQANIDANAAFNNARVAGINAGIERESALFNAERIRDIGERAHGAQVAQYGASGVQLNGSADDVMMDSALQNELEALVTIHSGELTAKGLEYGAEISKWQGASILTAAASKSAAVRWYGNMESSGIMLESTWSASALDAQAANATDNAIALTSMSSYIRDGTRLNQYSAIVNGLSGAAGAAGSFNRSGSSTGTRINS